MFSFHKPRVYRSTEGCCICRAKSSSSRFTDSRKYEEDSVRCFNLDQARHGEICNACVLLVKRYKRLPAGSTRHWGHVVDARAGPGTKSLTKYRKCKEDNEQQNSSPNAANVPGAKQVQQSKSNITEKFSKIFKKNKKNKSTTDVAATVMKKDTVASKSTSTISSSSWDTQSLPITPDSIESDYEDSLTTLPSTSNTVVQFQTETRASSYRSRANSAAVNAASTKRPPILSGSKRRKCLPPRKNHPNAMSNIQFYDGAEWETRKSCCGKVYITPKLPGAIFIDMEQYKPCDDHQNDKKPVVSAAKKIQATKPQKAIIATMPAVVQLAPPTATSFINTSTITPVLKKHHLFFKRQSECFPNGDVAIVNGINNNSCNSNTNILIKTESTNEINAIINNSTTTAQPYHSITAHNSTIVVPPYAANNSTTNISSHLLRHSAAKITTISTNPTNTTTTTTMNTPFNKTQNFLHKVKTDSGKIAKHSIEKIRIKAAEMQDMKQIVKTGDKSFVLASKPSVTPTAMNNQQTPNNNNNNNAAIYQQPLAVLNAAPQPLTIATLSGAGSSPSSSSSSTKFSDNSSDSGFDENMQDRKSASPMVSSNTV